MEHSTRVSKLVEEVKVGAGVLYTWPPNPQGLASDSFNFPGSLVSAPGPPAAARAAALMIPPTSASQVASQSVQRREYCCNARATACISFKFAAAVMQGTASAAWQLCTTSTTPAKQLVHVDRPSPSTWHTRAKRLVSRVCAS